MTSLPRERWDEPHFVYRIWSRDDVILYVGMTNNLEKRMTDHRLHSKFCLDIDDVVITQHPDRTTAARVETDEIRRLRPRHNMMGRGPRLGWTACDYFEAIEHHAGGAEGGKFSDTLPRLVHEFKLRYPNVAAQTLSSLDIPAELRTAS